MIGRGGRFAIARWRVPVPLIARHPHLVTMFTMDVDALQLRLDVDLSFMKNIEQF
jgi:hypothetical protein